MTRAEAIEILKKLIEAMQGHVTVLPTPERIAAIRLAIASLETDEAYQLEYENPTTKNNLGVDCISRDAVKYYIQAHIHEIITESGIDKNSHTNGVLRALLNGVDTMPSVTPQEPKTGHWNDIPKYKDIAWQCSECGHFTTMKHNYCPNCGAKMVEPQESEG